MQRQLGAHEIDIDAEAGWANFTLFEPRELDWAAIADTLDSANYEMHTLEIEVAGNVVRDGETLTLELDRSTQRLRLRGEAPVGQQSALRGTLGKDNSVTLQ